jgi:ABC-2 type transport system permease protein
MTMAVVPAGEFLAPQDESRAFWRLRRRIVGALLGQVFSRARFRFTLILVLSALLWYGLFWLFRDGFQFLRIALPYAAGHEETVRRVFGMFFAALMVMLVCSAGVILYGSLFCAPEVALLLTLAARPQRIFLHKFQEAVLFSSWGFVLLGSPMLLAYGVVAEAPWYYYAMLLPYLVAFLYIPAALGAILCLLVVRALPGRRRLLTCLALLSLAVFVGWIVWSLIVGPESEMLTPGWFQEITGRLRFTEGRWLPSWWLCTGLIEASQREWSEGVLFLGLLVANALFFCEVATWVAAGVYRPAYSAVQGHAAGHQRLHPAWLDRLLTRMSPILPRPAWLDWLLLKVPVFLPRPMRLMMVKDARLFRRDPLQWSQFLIFFGLLALYFINIRRFSYSLRYIGWVNMVSFLNLSVVGLLLSTFTTRFIFPMISLEGRRFWLLGLLPLKRDSILWSKFLFAAGGSIVPCAALILLSDCMLRVAWLVLLSHQLTCLLLCLGLSGIAVGLGARLPNTREHSPARIAAGFGGTLTLVISTLYILAIVLMTAVPYHFYLAAESQQTSDLLAEAVRFRWWLRTWLIAGTAGSVVLGAIATVVPMWIGFRAFRRWEL